MSTIIDTFNLIDKKFPFKDQQTWDKSGILFLNDQDYNDLISSEKVENILVSLDLNDFVIDYAIKNNCNLIIAHHPFYIDDKLTKKKFFKNIFKKLLENKIFFISCHTNFDISKKGMNYLLCKKLKLKKIERLNPISFSFCGYLSKKMDLNSFLYYLKNNLKINDIVINNCKNKKIKKICICGGSGSSEINLIKIKNKIDAFISSEIKWNYFNEKKDLVLIDIPHYCEYVFVEYWYNFFSKKFNNKKIFKIDFFQIKEQRKST